VKPIGGRRLASLVAFALAAVLLGVALSLLPVLLPAGAIVAHLGWLAVRGRRWLGRFRRADHADMRSSA
jgi:hypothetical protein